MSENICPVCGSYVPPLLFTDDMEAIKRLWRAASRYVCRPSLYRPCDKTQCSEGRLCAPVESLRPLMERMGA